MKELKIRGNREEARRGPESSVPSRWRRKKSGKNGEKGRDFS